MNSCLKYAPVDHDPDYLVDLLVRESDENLMPIPAIDNEPHLLISKVRKHYMEYIINLLSVNYENNQKLLNKNIYLPSAIWRCAKVIETHAAQTCMVVQLYRKNITAAIKELKNDTKKGKLNKKLYECLSKPPINEKKTQTISSNLSDCECLSNKRKKRQKNSSRSNLSEMEKPECGNDIPVFNIPVVANLQVESPQAAPNVGAEAFAKQPFPISVNKTILNDNNITPLNSKRMSIESQDSDDLMMQLEKLFQCDSKDEDLFESSLYDTLDFTQRDNIPKQPPIEIQTNPVIPDSVIENHAAKIKSLDERLASLENTGDNNNSIEKSQPPRNIKRHTTSKWLCEEYYLKSRLFELLDQIGDSNRKKLLRIKETLLRLFGDDSDEEGVISPLEETSEFVTSCKDRIAPWVLKLLTPYYVKGRIRGKALFKTLAKHLIRLIYQCSHYPQEYEVNSFVSDFLANHKIIRCEADFQQFRIDNL